MGWNWLEKEIEENNGSQSEILPEKSISYQDICQSEDENVLWISWQDQDPRPTNTDCDWVTQKQLSMD